MFEGKHKHETRALKTSRPTGLSYSLSTSHHWDIPCQNFDHFMDKQSQACKSTGNFSDFLID